MQRVFVGVAGVFGLAAVAMAAAAAHALGGLDPAALRAVQSGVEIQGWHALALLGTALWLERRPERRPRRLAVCAGLCFAVGTVLFCAAVYAFGLAGVSLDAVAPTGGILLMLGWLLLAASAL